MSGTTDPGPVARFEALKVDVDFPAVVFGRLTDAESPETLPQIAKELKIPRGKFVEWFTTVHRDKYDSALRVLTDAMAFEALKIADDADPEKVAKAKLRVDVRLRTAARWDRERYGEREPANVAVVVSLVDVAREIRELEAKLGLPALPGERVVEALPETISAEEAAI